MKEIPAEVNVGRPVPRQRGGAGHFWGSWSISLAWLAGAWSKVMGGMGKSGAKVRLGTPGLVW